MRVGIVSATVFPVPPPGYSGLEHLAWLTAKGLAEAGHEVILYAPDGSTCPGVQVFHFGPAGQIDEKTAYSKYWGTLAQLDVIVDESWEKWTDVGKQEGWLKCPVLAVMHAPINTMINALPPPGRLSFVLISEDQRAHFEGLHGRKARACYNGVDPDFYQAIQGVKRTDRFLFLARFSSIKGPDLAIKACLYAGVGLDLVGDTQITNEPDYLKECMQLAKKQSPEWDKSKGKQIRIHGNMTRAECVWWYSQAHCMIHPNERFREPFGLAPVEAMACGVPVIAWDNGAMRETIVHNDTGLLVNSFDMLASAVQFMSVRGVNMNREGCREQALKFTVRRMIARYEELCEEAIRSPW